MKHKIPILICLLIVLSACEKKAEEEIKPVVQRTEYSPEEFGIGRRHTPDRACNRSIDAYLNKIRLCYKNYGISKKCENVQQSSNGSIKKLKNSIRCAR